MIAYDGKLDWKIRRDSFYWPLYEKHGFEHIVNAGFFYDDSDKDLDIAGTLKMLCTPLVNISKPNTSKHCVLVTTGSMCPIHDGHIQMVVRAKERLQSAGYEVLGGYICPDHDSYVSRKTGAGHINIYDRCVLVSEKIWEHNLGDWLAVDPWYGIFNECDRNFTDLVTRTKLYLKEHTGIETEIAYVCGGDVANFSKAFEDQGLCVVATRPGYDKTAGIAETNRIYKVECDSNCSSSSIRVSEKYKAPPKRSLKIRMDGTMPIIDVISRHFTEVNKIKIHDQMRSFEDIPGTVVSLDPLIRGDNHLGISRLYDVFGHYKIGYHVWEQEELPAGGKCTLYDDDIYTGNTMRFATELLNKKGIVVDKYVSFNITEDSGIEVLDNRDFVMFAQHAGLVIKYKDTYVRAPYVYPFVDPRIRCSVLEPMRLSMDIWKFNMDIYDGNDLKLKDIDTGMLYTLIGFDANTRLYDICKYYYYQLKGIIYE